LVENAFAYWVIFSVLSLIRVVLWDLKVFWFKKQPVTKFYSLLSNTFNPRNTDEKQQL
jgi:hypothetical protein